MSLSRDSVRLVAGRDAQLLIYQTFGVTFLSTCLDMSEVWAEFYFVELIFDITGIKYCSERPTVKKVREKTVMSESKFKNFIKSLTLSFCDPFFIRLESDFSTLCWFCLYPLSIPLSLTSNFRTISVLDACLRTGAASLTCGWVRLSPRRWPWHAEYKLVLTGWPADCELWSIMFEVYRN